MGEDAVTSVGPSPPPPPAMTEEERQELQEELVKVSGVITEQFQTPRLMCFTSNVDL